MPRRAQSQRHSGGLAARSFRRSMSHLVDISENGRSILVLARRCDRYDHCQRRADAYDLLSAGSIRTTPGSRANACRARRGSCTRTPRRPSQKITKVQWSRWRELHQNPEISIDEIYRTLKILRSTFYRIRSNVMPKETSLLIWARLRKRVSDVRFLQLPGLWATQVGEFPEKSLSKY